MKHFLLTLFLGTISTFSTPSFATPPDTLCEAQAGRLSFKLLIAKHAFEKHPDDFREFTVNGTSLFKFPESAVHRILINEGTEEDPFIINAETARIGKNKIKITYPEQDHESEEISMYLDIKVPGKSFQLNQLEMICRAY